LRANGYLPLDCFVAIGGLCGMLHGQISEAQTTGEKDGQLAQAIHILCAEC